MRDHANPRMPIRESEFPLLGNAVRLPRPELRETLAGSGTGGQEGGEDEVRVAVQVAGLGQSRQSQIRRPILIGRDAIRTGLERALRCASTPYLRQITV